MVFVMIGKVVLKKDNIPRNSDKFSIKIVEFVTLMVRRIPNKNMRCDSWGKFVPIFLEGRDISQAAKSSKDRVIRTFVI